MTQCDLSNSNLSTKKCVPCEGGIAPLNTTVIEHMLAALQDWKLDDTTQEIYKKFQFQNFYKTMAFVNAIAWMAHQQDHHPDMEVGYNYCKVRYVTHAINGLSENDFICAAKVDKLLEA